MAGLPIAAKLPDGGEQFDDEVVVFLRKRGLGIQEIVDGQFEGTEVLLTVNGEQEACGSDFDQVEKGDL